MEDNDINNMNQKLDKLIEKNELLEKENKDIKARLIKAEDNIKNLNKQQIFMRIEYKKIFHALEEKYITLLDNKFKKIIQNEEKNQNKHEENEIIINEKPNNNEDLLNFKNINNLIQKSIESKFNEIQNNIWDIFEQKKEIKIDPKKEKKIDDNIKKLEDNLNKIYNNKSEKIPENYINDLKKLTNALLILKKDPLLIGREYFKKLEDNIEKSDENVKNHLIKKINIMNQLDNILKEFKNILTHDDKEFKIKFRIKYGITEKDIKDRKLDNLIKKHNGKEKDMIKELLMNLKYIS